MNKEELEKYLKRLEETLVLNLKNNIELNTSKIWQDEVLKEIRALNIIQGLLYKGFDPVFDFRLCKDCKYFRSKVYSYAFGKPVEINSNVCNRLGIATKQDGFCFLAEPKSSEGLTDKTE